ncbi:MAG TPA: segregation/condensation protein A [Candidatus Deferrimicrobium sp.]|nr:segregation/condensation protein A [Candidatus Deferrimicrobium sp.]
MATEVSNTRVDDYRVDLSVFQGPLDLLLYLIQKEEVDIYDIPLARITSQYLKYVDMMTSLNLEMAGEFILMAATLIRIKTRLLLPRDGSETDEPDPREELIWALLEYKKFREASEILREKALLEERNYIPPAPVDASLARVEWQQATTLFDLLTAFRDILTARKSEVVHQVDVEQVSLLDRMTYVLQYLRTKDVAVFEELFADLPGKVVAVVTFIALLELARTRRVTIEQSRPFAHLRVYRGRMFDAVSEAVEEADDVEAETKEEVSA